MTSSDSTSRRSSTPVAVPATPAQIARTLHTGSGGRTAERAPITPAAQKQHTDKGDLLARLQAMVALYRTSRDNLLAEIPPGMQLARRGLAAIHEQYADDIEAILARATVPETSSEHGAEKLFQKPEEVFGADLLANLITAEWLLADLSPNGLVREQCRTAIVRAGGTPLSGRPYAEDGQLRDDQQDLPPPSPPVASVTGEGEIEALLAAIEFNAKGPITGSPGHLYTAGLRSGLRHAANMVRAALLSAPEQSPKGAP